MTQPPGDPGSEAQSPVSGGQFVPPGDPVPPAQPFAQSYPQASWGQVPPSAGAAPATEGLAVAALVCAVLSWIALPVVLAIVALLVARSAERNINASGGLKSGFGMVSAARWIAWINLLLFGMVVAFVAAFIVAVAVGG